MAKNNLKLKKQKSFFSGCSASASGKIKRGKTDPAQCNRTLDIKHRIRHVFRVERLNERISFRLRRLYDDRGRDERI